MYDNNTNRYNIVFQGNPKCYSYGRDRVVWLKHPVKVDPNIYRFIHDGKYLSNIETILIFSNTIHTYYHIRFNNGKESDYNKSNLLITKSCLEGPVATNVFNYLKQVANENSLSADDGSKLLVKQYSRIDFIADDTAVAPYLNPQKFRMYKKSTNTLIYPFGCNASQIKAVQSAFENQISVIQGPPGTGKTQTILNIIANILKSGKTVQVVSNNNSAIQNVLEKLSKYDMGFMVAL
ncbi:MAG: AAA domain-containing protein, partial [Candidatus Riflebacteria bacterium]|nr:AAA domain-containing protein [Candidatus Riflebacteria bacterium]